MDFDSDDFTFDEFENLDDVTFTPFEHAFAPVSTQANNNPLFNALLHARKSWWLSKPHDSNDAKRLKQRELAILMKDYNPQLDDDFAFTGFIPFRVYFVTYLDLNERQLQCFFLWRAQVRKGIYPADISDSYIFLYLYDILSDAICDNPNHGYDLLQEVLFAYGNRPHIQSYCTEWLRDYVVWHNLTDKVHEAFKPILASDDDTLKMRNISQTDDDTLFDFVSRLSSVHLSVLSKKAPELTRGVTAKSVRNLDQWHKEKGTSLSDVIFGSTRHERHIMFNHSMVIHPSPSSTQSFHVNDTRFYTQTNGKWFIDFIHPSKPNTSILKSFLKEVEHVIRHHLGMKPTKETWNAPDIHHLISNAIAEWEKEEQERHRPKVEVDFSKLARIRQDAEQTKRSLIVEEENEENNDWNNAKEQPQPVEANDNINETSLSSNTDSLDWTIIGMMLNGGDWKSLLRSQGKMLTTFIEHLNELFYDDLGDSVADENGVVEDYIAYLREKYESR